MHYTFWYISGKDKELIGPVVQMKAKGKDVLVYMIVREGDDEAVDGIDLAMKQYVHSDWAKGRFGELSAQNNKENAKTLAEAFNQYFPYSNEDDSDGDENIVMEDEDDDGAKVERQLTKKEKQELKENKEAVKKTDVLVADAQKKMQDERKVIPLQKLERAPDNFQARPLYTHIVDEIVKAMQTDKTYLEYLPPFMVMPHGDEQKRKDGFYWIFDGNHNMTAMNEMFEATGHNKYKSHACQVYKDLLDYEAAILGARQNEKIKNVIFNTEFDHTFALRWMCKREHPGADPPGQFADINARHMGILGKTKLEYVGSGGRKTVASSTYHEKFFASQCTEKAWEALTELYQKTQNPPLKMNQKYRHMNKLPPDVIEAVLVWANSRKKIPTTKDWFHINKMCTSLADEHKVLQKEGQQLTKDLCTKKKLDNLYGGSQKAKVVVDEVSKVFSISKKIPHN